jgi:hypothetical protein
MQGLLGWLHRPRDDRALGRRTIQVHWVKGALDTLCGGSASGVSGLQLWGY